MGNADYVAAFLHVLLPLAFEVTLGGGGGRRGGGFSTQSTPSPHQSGIG